MRTSSDLHIFFKILPPHDILVTENLLMLTLNAKQTINQSNSTNVVLEM